MVKRSKAPDLSKVYTELAGKSSRARMMSEVEEFRSVRTILAGVNRATGVGGIPLSNVALFHGPTGGGKTALVCAIIRSFQNAGGLVVFVDAEQSGETKRWFPALGVDTTKCLYIGRTGEGEKIPPLTYEETVREVDGVIERYQKMKRSGQIATNTPLFLGVDSLSKLVPDSLFKDLKAKGGKALRSGVGRLQAAMNTTWFLELGPKVGDDDILFAAIAHEMEAEGNGKWAPDFKVRGGRAIAFDSMLQFRVTFAGQIRDKSEEGAPAIGKRHRVKIIKNKHGVPFTEAYFYTSAGSGACPIGFDRVREIVHEGILRGVVEGPEAEKGSPKLTLGSEIAFGKKKRKLGAFYKDLEAAEMLDEIEAELDRTALGET